MRIQIFKEMSWYRFSIFDGNGKLIATSVSFDTIEEARKVAIKFKWSAFLCTISGGA